MKKLLLTLLIGVMMVSCETNEGKISTDLVNNPASATKANNTKEPTITFDVMEHDFGKMIQGEVVSYTFKFKNTGNAPLLISDVEKTCGCTDIKFNKMPVNPGESGSITINYDSNSHKGFQNKRVVVIANTNPAETILRFKAQVETIDNF